MNPINGSILFVDDVPSMRTLLRGMLQNLGYSQLVEADDGVAAWEILKRSANASEGKTDGVRIGLVIADWNMPGMSGAELLRAIRSSVFFSELPFVMVTAKNDQYHLNQAENLGVNDYVVKPFQAQQLGKAIQSALAGKRF